MSNKMKQQQVETSNTQRMLFNTGLQQHLYFRPPFLPDSSDGSEELLLRRGLPSV